MELCKKKKERENRWITGFYDNCLLLNLLMGGFTGVEERALNDLCNMSKTAVVGGTGYLMLT